jgi:hypothetical protein
MYNRVGAMISVAAVLVGLILMAGEAAPQAQAHGPLPEAVVLSDDQTAGPLGRPGDLVVVADRVWIVDAFSHRVVGASTTGEPPITLGRRGGGPGEFQQPGVLHRLPDGSLWVWDYSASRWTAFSLAGEEARTSAVMPSEVPGLSRYMVFPLQDGLAAVFNTSMSPINPATTTEGTQGVLARLDGRGQVVDTMATFPLSGAWAFTGPAPRGGVGITVTSPFSDAPPHGDFTPACGGVIAVVTGGRDFRIRFFDMAGRPRGELEQAIQGEPVTRNEWQAYLSGQPPEIRRLVERRTPPTRHAAVQALRLTSDGHLWVRTTFHGPGVTRDTWHTWRLEWNGDTLAVGSHRTVQLPSRFTVHDADGDLLWGIHRGEYDIPTARAYRLPWPAARGCHGPSPNAPHEPV